MVQMSVTKSSDSDSESMTDAEGRPGAMLGVSVDTLTDKQLLILSEAMIEITDIIRYDSDGDLSSDQQYCEEIEGLSDLDLEEGEPPPK